MNKIILIIFLFFITLGANAEILQDDFASTSLKYSKKPIPNTNYDYTSTHKIPIVMNFLEDYGSEVDIFEGQNVLLKVKEDVVFKDKIIARKGDIARAKIGVVISTGMNGIPASVILKDFKINNISKNKLSNTYEVFGQDRSLFVFPLKWALTPLPPTGSLTNFIMGGHVRLKENKKIIVYYYP